MSYGVLLNMASATRVEDNAFEAIYAPLLVSYGACGNVISSIAFVRGRVYLHFDDEAEAVAELEAAGFGAAAVRSSRSRLVHIIEASTG